MSSNQNIMNASYMSVEFIVALILVMLIVAIILMYLATRSSVENDKESCENS